MKALQSSYPGDHYCPNNLAEVNWKSEWFSHVSKYPRSYWESSENQRKFLEVIAMTHKINEPTDWKRVTTAAIIKSGGSVRTTYMN